MGFRSVKGVRRMVRVRNLEKKFVKGKFRLDKVKSGREINAYTCYETEAYKPETRKHLLIISLWWYELRFILKG